MALIKCSECGHQVSDQAVSCPMCGIPINGIAPHSSAATYSGSVIKLVWGGKYAVTEIPMEVKVNGKHLGTYSYNSGFEVYIPITANVMELTLNAQGINSTFKLQVKPNENYTCNISLGTMGVFNCELYNEDEDLVHDDKLGCVMSFLIVGLPIIGIIYYFVKRKEYPSKAKSALLWAIVAWVVWLVISYREYLPF